jgi:thioredoxin-related protein
MFNLVLFITALIIVLISLLIYRWNTQKIKPHYVTLFYRDGCVHCELFKPEWAKVESILKDRAKKYNTSDPKTASIATQYNVSGVPTIILLDKEGQYETYYGSRDSDSILARFT